MFYIANEDDIRNGRVTDVYFERASQILTARGLTKHVAMEIRTKVLPANWEWAVFSGLEEIMELLKGRPVDVRAVPEGTIFSPYDPVMEIQGNYADFGAYETEILGLMCQASGIATRSARVKLAAGFKPVFSFGARRMHPAIAPMIERSAYIGGCDGVSVGLDAEKIGIKPSGTMPHALILLVGDTVRAAVYFDEVIDRSVPRLILIDTFNDEKFEAICVAEALRDRLYGVRLDTPGSRRGNMVQIVKETKWELGLRGHGDVKVMVSGGLDEDKVGELQKFVDLFGIGTYISNSPVVDFAMDIVEIEHKPSAKRGKESGRKTLLRCKGCGGRTVLAYPGDITVCAACGGTLEDIMRPVMTQGQVIADLPSASRIRDTVLNEIKEYSVKEKR